MTILVKLSSVNQRLQFAGMAQNQLNCKNIGGNDIQYGTKCILVDNSTYMFIFNLK